MLYFKYCITYSTNILFREINDNEFRLRNSSGIAVKSFSSAHLTRDSQADVMAMQSHLLLYFFQDGRDGALHVIVIFCFLWGKRKSDVRHVPGVWRCWPDISSWKALVLYLWPWNNLAYQGKDALLFLSPKAVKEGTDCPLDDRHIIHEAWEWLSKSPRQRGTQSKGNARQRGSG